MGEAAQLADELQRRSAHFFVGRRRFEIEKGADVATHRPALAIKAPRRSSMAASEGPARIVKRRQKRNRPPRISRRSSEDTSPGGALALKQRASSSNRRTREHSPLPAKSSVKSRYAEVRPNTTAIVAAIMPGGAIDTSTLEATLKTRAALAQRL